MKHADVVIVGAGLAGLSLGALLADRGGRRVIVLEKSAAPGGRVRVVERGGFLLDWGIHAMLNAGGSEIARVIRKSGGNLRVRPAGMCVEHEGRLEPLMAENVLMQLFGRQPVSLTDAGKIAWRLIRGGDRELRRVKEMSLAEWVSEVRAGPRLDRMARAIGIGLFAVDDIRDASAWEFFKFLSRVVSRGHAIGYPAGGWRAVIDALRRPIEDSGRAALRLGARVKEVEVKSGRAAGVRLAGGEKLSAETVVWAAPAQALPAALPAGTLGEEVEKHFLGMRSTFGVNIDFALKKPVSREKRCIVTLDPPTLGWFVSNVEPAVAPKGKQLLTVFSPISPEKWADREFRDRRRAALRDTYTTMFPEIEKEILWERPLDTLVNAARGDTGQTRGRRPGHRVEGVGGLLLIGDSAAGRGFGGEISADSALRVFKMLEKTG